MTKKTGFYTREITFNNTDQSLFDAMVGFCRDLGFPVGTYFTKRSLPCRDIWNARVSANRSVYERFQQLIPLQSSRKRQALQEIIDSYVDRDALTAKRRKGEETTCHTCDKQFYAPPSQRTKFCSMDCAAIGRITRRTKICEVCSKQFEVIKARSLSRFCSIPCFAQARILKLSQRKSSRSINHLDPT